MADKKKHTKNGSGTGPLVTRGKHGRFMKRSASGEPMDAMPHTDIVLSRHAHQAHAKQESRPITLQSNATRKEKASGHKHPFSFPVALSQVRDHVYTRSKAVKPTRPVKKAKAKPVSVYSSALSPFVLDLKHRRTVVHHSLPNLHTAKRAKKADRPQPQQQGVLSLFEDQGSSGLPQARFSWRSWFPGLAALGRGKSHINFVPRTQPFSLRRKAKRSVSSAAWLFVMASRALQSPIQYFNRRRMQKSLQLQWGNTLVSETPYVTQKTLSGKPIASRHLHPLLRMRQAVSAVTLRRPASLSALDEEATRPSWTAGLSVRSLARATAPFAVTCGVVALVVMAVSAYQQVRDYRRQVLAASNVAMSQLQKATSTAGSLAFMPASGQFETAAQSFKAAAAVMENQASPVAKIAQVLPGINGKVKSAQALLKLGGDLSSAAKDVSDGASVFSDASHFLADQPLSYKLEYFFVRLKEAQPLIDASLATVKDIDTSVLPADAADQVEQLRQTLPLMDEQLSRLALLQEPLLAFLGHEHLERHLVVFENNTELRATGGFMGSLALVDMDRGQITGIDIPGGGPYDFQGSLTAFEQSPRALRLINPRWELQDANWFLDWPTSAAKVASFYEKAGGPSVDSVIAVDTNVLQSLLKVLGPVKLPAYGVEINADNFRGLLQDQVEAQYDKTQNKPKKIIADLAPILLDRIKSMPAGKALELAAVLSDRLQQRDILLAAHNPDVQSVFTQFGWGGEVVPTKGDYVSVVHTNLAGGKTDGVISDAYDLNVHIDDDGLSTHTLTIKRVHNGVKGAAYSGVRNVDYLRVYVPEGSELVSATASNLPPANLFEQPDPKWSVDPTLAAGDANYRIDPESNTEIYEESGKRVFAQWVQLDPGKEATVTLVYTVPSLVRNYPVPQREASWTDWFSNQPVRPDQTVRLYSLYWQKQPGAWDPQLTVHVNHPQQWQVQPMDNQVTVDGPGTVSLTSTQEQDRQLQLIFY